MIIMVVALFVAISVVGCLERIMKVSMRHDLVNGVYYALCRLVIRVAL